MYKLILSGSVLVPSWTLEFNAKSDSMAREYCEHILRSDPCSKGAMYADLFNVELDSHVIRYSITTKTEIRHV